MNRGVIFNAIADRLSSTQKIALYPLGSFGETSVKHEEYDLVILLDDESTRQPTVTALFEVPDLIDIPTELQICNAFVPRSYCADLTIHCALYSESDARLRRPRLIRHIAQRSPSLGSCKWINQLHGVSWRLHDLLTERWGLIDILKIIVKGGWEAERWAIDNGKPTLVKENIHISSPHVLPELLWYSMSKLTKNLADYSYNTPELYDITASAKITIDNLRSDILVPQNEEIMWSFWCKWLDLFQIALPSKPEALLKSLSA